MKKLLGVFGVLLVCVSMFAGPFGIEMGWTKEQCEEAGVVFEANSDKEEFGVYTCFITPPKVHPDFPIYMLQIDNEYGVYQIVCITQDIETSVYGTELKNKFNSIKEQLSKTYDEPKNYDYLKSGSIWSEPEDWMYSLKFKERVLFSKWDFENKDLSDVLMIATAENDRTGEIILYFDSNKISFIEERIENEQSSVF